MFLDFAGMMINTNYIISIYKTKNYNKIYEINIQLYPNDNIVKEIYSNPKEATIRFDEIIEKINK